MARLALIRHGQTDWNLHGRIQGSSDIPLNDTGREQAREAGRRLAELGGDWAGLYSSPLLRARETAEIIGAVLGIDYRGALPPFAERRYGPAEGMVSSEVRERYPDLDLVPGIETRAQVIERTHAAALALAADAPEGAQLIVVSHGGVIGSLVRHVTDWRLPRHGEYIVNGGIYEFDARAGRLQLTGYPNDPAAPAALLVDPAR